MINRLHFSAHLSRLFSKGLVRDASVVFVAQAGATAILLLSSIVLARQWGPTSYGTLTTLFSITTFAVGFTDLGIGITLVRLVGKYRTEQPARCEYLITMTLVLEALIGASLIVMGILLTPFLSEILFHDSSYIGLVRISLITAGVLSASVWVSAVLQAHQRYNSLAVWIVVPITLRVAGIVGATFFLQSISAVVWVYLLAAVSSTVVGILVTFGVYSRPGALRYSARKSANREFLGFAKWIAATIILGTIANRFDVFLLAFRSNPTQVGIYAVGAQIVALAPLIVNTMNTILMPRVSSLRNRADYRGYFRQASGISILASTGLLVLLVSSSFLIQTLYGPEFLPAVPVFRVLLLAYIITILSWPFLLLAYAFDRPDIFAKVNLVQVAVQLSGNLILIPMLGALSPALMFLIITVMGISIMGIWIALIYRKRAAGMESIGSERLAS